MVIFWLRNMQVTEDVTESNSISIKLFIPPADQDADANSSFNCTSYVAKKQIN